MKIPFLQRLPLVLLLGLSATASTVAQSGPDQLSGPGTALRPELKAYLEATVLPVLRQQRQKLEAQLAPADQAQIAAYRAQLKELKAQGQALRLALVPTAPATRPTPTEAQQEQVRALRRQGKAIMLSVAQLALKYDTNIRALAQEIEPQKQQWTATITAIVAKNTTPEQQAKLARWQGAARHNGLRKLLRPAFFLLLDPHAPAENVVGSSGTSLYPNPAVATTQLQYSVQKPGSVTIDLLDGTGSQLRRLVPETRQEPGAYTQQLDLGDLPRGTYFYKITTAAGTETKRFVKE